MKKKYISKKEQSNYEKRAWTRIINCLSGFKSVNLVGTINDKKQTNLSVISSCFHVGANPPLMGFILRPHSSSSPRHTFINIKEMKVFTINHFNKDIYKKGHQASARYPYEVSEFDEVGLGKEFKDGFLAPYVEESNIQIGLKLIEIMDISYNKTHMVLGEIEHIYIPTDSLKEDGFIDIEHAGTLSLSGLDSYHETSRLSRLSYAKPNKKLTEID